MWKKKKKVAMYVVWKGRTPGLYRTWAEVQAQTDGFKGARFKGYTSESEARMIWNLGFEEYEKGRKFEKGLPEHRDGKIPQKISKADLAMIDARARRNIREGGSTGSRTTTCTSARCTFPACLC